MNRRRFEQIRRERAVRELRLERKITDVTLSCYRQWLPLVADAALPTLTAPALTAAAPGPIPPDLAALVFTRPQWEQVLASSFLPALEDAGAEEVLYHLRERNVDLELFGAEVDTSPVAGGKSKAIPKVYRVPGVREWQAAYLESVNNRMVQTPDWVFRQLAHDVDTGMAHGEPVAVLRDRVQKYLDITGVDWAGRAELVARTEATGAANGAALAAAHGEQILWDEPLLKCWVATLDQRTRDSHFAADGQTRPLDGMFVVGGYDMPHPGKGPVHEVANCRCTLAILDADEDLPETDRHTERSATDATVRNREGTQNDEINRRADDGVIRAREDPQGDGYVTAAASPEGDTIMGDTMTRRTWTGTLAPIGTPTGDGRIISPSVALSFREFPQPLAWQKTSDMGHLQSVVIGGILAARRVGDVITAEGFLLDTPEATEAAALIEAGLIRPSIDPTDVVWEQVDQSGTVITADDLETAFTAGTELVVLDQFAEMKVAGATLVSTPAFENVKIILDEPGDGTTEVTQSQEDALVASVAAAQITDFGYYVPDPAVFDDPQLPGPVGIHMREGDGRIVGHIAQWGSCHIGSPEGRCQTAPEAGPDGYDLFHASEIGTPEGPLAVGKLTYGGGHADIRAGFTAAVEHYDNTGVAWALGRVGEDAHGIWFSGIRHPSASKELVADALSSPVSGDWRRRGGVLRMIAALAVNTPGFPVPRGYRADGGADVSLVASGALAPPTAEADAPIGEVIARAAAAAVEGYAARAARIHDHNKVAARLRDHRLRAHHAMAARLKERA